MITKRHENGDDEDEAGSGDVELVIKMQKKDNMYAT